MRVITSRQRLMEEAALCVITSSAMSVLHSGTGAAVLPFVLMTVAAHRVPHVVLVNHVKTVMVTGAVHPAVPELCLIVRCTVC